MKAILGQDDPFGRAPREMKLLAGLDVTAKSVERTAEVIGAAIAKRETLQIQQAKQLLTFPEADAGPVPILYIQMDGTGIPTVKKETEKRKGKTAGESAHTREVKLGCVFTQTTWDKDGYAVRDPDSTTYTGAIEPAAQFGDRLYLEAWRRGWKHAHTKVVMGDGAEWIWNLAAQHFPGALQIVDLYHAREHLAEIARGIYPEPQDEIPRKRWINLHQPLLDQGKIKKLTLALRSISTPNAPLAHKIHLEIEYFRRNAMRMRYPKFRRLHLFVGSGVIEAGCKTVIGQRLKQSGMSWTLNGANAIIALRCCVFNRRFEDYWESRRSA